MEPDPGHSMNRKGVFMTGRVGRHLLAAMLISATVAVAQGRDFQGDVATINTLGKPAPQWVWVDSFAGTGVLLNVGTGRYLGSVSGGDEFAKIDTGPDRRTLYSAETYYSRETRGTRTDVVTFYSPHTLAPTGEVKIPVKRFQGVPVVSVSGVTGDGRFMLVYNMTPAQSVSVVNVARRRFVGEIATPGCALIYPSGRRRFHMICGNGTLLTVDLNDDGTQKSRSVSKRFFNPLSDPIRENAVRRGDTWYFVSYDGVIHEVDVSGAAPRFSSWPLPGLAGSGWRVGGRQPLAIQNRLRRLYVVVHKGGADTHKQPGKQVWVYDLHTHARVSTLHLKHPASVILVTPGAHPLLVAAGQEADDVDVYGLDGRLLRTVKSVGDGIFLLQNYLRPGADHG